MPLSGGAESPFNTMSPGPCPTSVPNGIFIHPAVWPQQTWAKTRGCATLGEAGSPCNTMSPRPTSTSLPSGILIDSAVWPQQTGAENWVAAVPLLGGAGPHVTQCGLGRGLPHTNYHLDPCSHLTTTPGPKLGCCVPFFWGGSGIPI